MTGQLFFFLVPKRHQSEPGEQAAQQHVISETQDRKKRIWVQIIFAPCFVSPSSSFSREEVENCAPSSEAKGLQRISNIRSILQNESKTKILLCFLKAIKLLGQHFPCKPAGSSHPLSRVGRESIQAELQMLKPDFHNGKCWVLPTKTVFTALQF